ncbi:putative ABC transport system ATP-binding protein [Nocardioides massiliensis]|uniref:ABC transport system ATP-binding protein n=2 Tax=Nocardioides massiliensis TaxID=1325935 RepID=A0ABT9NKP0_9ACTN|nr:ABC transporter ATP-binding protein [Nocardioides massiliensis]MDP9820986.1 putative ABC transport system ATP-binding protein [Nocardioides massiliensis]
MTTPATRTASPSPHAASPDHPAPPAVLARDLTRTYGRGASIVHALDGVDLDLAVGRFTAVMGPSGSGKSTLLHCLAGLDNPTSGSVRIAGAEIGTLDDDALTRFRRDHLGFVFQSFNLLPMLTAEQNVLLPFELAGRRPDRARFDEIVDVLGIRDRLNHRPSELSGGQQQRVAIARALVTDPSVIFADEPTGNLDSTSSAEILGYLRRSVRELGHTVVMVTHEVDAAAYADDVLLLADGKVADHLVEPGRDALLRALRREA